MGTLTWLRLAISTPFRIASGTSRAFPRPAPTRPLPSPTTTRAENENLRPPLTTLATRFRLTSRSLRSERSPAYEGFLIATLLELQSGLAGRVRESLDPTVVEEPAAVEDHRCDPGVLGPAR